MARFLLPRRGCFSTAAALLLVSNGARAFGSKSFMFSSSPSPHVSRQMSSTDTTGASEQSCSCSRVLLLHGSGGTADGFTETMEHWREAIMAQAEPHKMDLQFTAIQAPKVKEDGYSWWSMPPGVRSFTAETYGDGFEESAEKVLQTMQQQDPPFDLVVGHSQGAILATALIALGKNSTASSWWIHSEWSRLAESLYTRTRSLAHDRRRGTESPHDCWSQRSNESSRASHASASSLGASGVRTNEHFPPRRTLGAYRKG
jgi:pimeloyl-ACP methyl ester carboxylesterase